MTPTTRDHEHHAQLRIWWRRRAERRLCAVGARVDGPNTRAGSEAGLRRSGGSPPKGQQSSRWRREHWRTTRDTWWPWQDMGPCGSTYASSCDWGGHTHALGRQCRQPAYAKTWDWRRMWWGRSRRGCVWLQDQWMFEYPCDHMEGLSTSRPSRSGLGVKDGGDYYYWQPQHSRWHSYFSQARWQR